MFRFSLLRSAPVPHRGRDVFYWTDAFLGKYPHWRSDAGLTIFEGALERLSDQIVGVTAPPFGRRFFGSTAARVTHGDAQILAVPEFTKRGPVATAELRQAYSICVAPSTRNEVSSGQRQTK